MSPARFQNTLNFMFFFPQSSINDLSFLVFLLALMYYVYTCTPRQSVALNCRKNNEKIAQPLWLAKLIHNFHIEEEQ